MPTPSRNSLLSFQSIVEERAQKLLEEAKKKGVDRSGGKRLMTPQEVADTKNMSGAARPVDFIEPYYGDKFAKEVQKAKQYNDKTKVIEDDSYARMYDKVAFERDPDTPKGSYYSPKNQTVGLKNKRAIEILAKNDKTMAEVLTSKDKDDEEYQQLIKNNLMENSFEKADYGEKTPLEASAAEHEYTHHATRPYMIAESITDPDDKQSIMDKAYRAEILGNLGGVHTAGSTELTQAAARFQRELFKTTGRRIENPKEFMELIGSDDTLEKLTPEARRYAVFARNLLNKKEFPDDAENYKDRPEEDKKRRDEYRQKMLQHMSEILPATVSVDPEASFESSVEQRLNPKRRA